MSKRKKLSDLRKKVRGAAKKVASEVVDEAVAVGSKAAEVGAEVGDRAAEVGAEVGERAAEVGERAAEVGAEVGARAVEAGAEVHRQAHEVAEIAATEGVAAARAEVRRRLREGTKAMLGNVFLPMAGAAMRDMGVRPPKDRSGIAPGSYAEEYDEVIQVTVVLRPGTAVSQAPGRSGRRGRGRLSREELAARFGASTEDIAAVEQFAAENDLRVTNVSAAQRRVTLEGRVTDVEDAFQLRMNWYDHQFHPHRGFDAPPAIPEGLMSVVTAVLGISDKPQANVELPAAATEAGAGAVDLAVEEVTLTGRSLGRLYGFPKKHKGDGEVVAVLLLGGGWYQEDLEEQMRSLDLDTPTVTVAEVDGRGNNPCDKETLDEYVSWLNEGTKIHPFTLMEALWTVECTQDVEMIASLAPDAEIVVFFAPNTDSGITNALAAVLDHPKEPTVLSISWSQTERSASDDFLATVEEELALLGHAGVTICCASGDRGSYNGEKFPSVAYPASSPHVLGCGGTTLSTDGESILDETTWNAPLNGKAAATGGGASHRFEVPDWQADCTIPATGKEGGGRGVPDVASVADPSTGMVVHMGSGTVLSAGTSAAAPLWGAFVACVNSAREDPLGWVTGDLYAIAKKGGERCLRPITEGHNDIDTDGGMYTAHDGWNPCGGLGSPVGKGLFKALVALE